MDNSIDSLSAGPVKLIHATPDAEKLLVYMARVSSPHQEKEESDKLIKYLIAHQHWSPFEMIDMCVEIKTSRAISAQILRHRSFSFQEFSQRYAKAALGFETYEARRQDLKNRQNSIDDMDPNVKAWFEAEQGYVYRIAERAYTEALSHGIAKEQARFLLPSSTTTKLYMKGSIRSWIHYLNLRTDAATQKEHRDIALVCKDIFVKTFPVTAKALNWIEV